MERFPQPQEEVIDYEALLKADGMASEVEAQGEAFGDALDVADQAAAAERAQRTATEAAGDEFFGQL